MRLYTAANSPNGKRVLICAAELGLSLDVAFLDYMKGEQRAPEYLVLNPMGKWPTLTDGPYVLWESAAILCYLSTEHGSRRLLPSGTKGEAEALRWMFFGACHLDPYFTALMGERYLKARRNLPPDETATEAAEKQLARFVPVVEHKLSMTDYVAQDFSLADITLGCTLELSPLLSYDLTPYPHVRAWLDRLQARESWRAASAPPPHAD
jgi:glutathione S-transferase